VKKELILENRLILEITRQLELMGVKSSFLNEELVGPGKGSFLKQAITGIVELFPKTPIEEIVAGNAQSLIKQLKSEGIEDAEQLLKHMKSGNGLVFVEKNLNKDFIKALAKRIFVDSKFSVVARQAIGEYLSNYTGVIKLSNGKTLTLKEASESIIKTDLKKHPEAVDEVEYLYQEIVKNSGLQHHDSMKFLRKQINDSKNGLHPSNVVDNSIDDVIDDIPSNTTTDVVTDIPNNGLKPIPNQVPNQVTGGFSLSGLTTKIIGKNVDEIIKKIKISGILFADEVANNFSRLLLSGKELVGDELVFYSAVMRKVFPQKIDEYIEGIRLALRKKGKEPLMKQLEIAVGNKNTPVDEIVAWSKKELGIELSPTTVQVWRDKKLNVGFVNNSIQIRIPGSLLFRESTEFFRYFGQGVKNTVNAIGVFLKDIGVGFTDHGIPALLLRRIYKKNMTPLGDLKTEIDELFQSIYNKIDRGEDTNIVPELDKLYKILYNLGKRRDTARKVVFEQWMNALKKDGGPEGQVYKRLFEKDPEYSQFYYANWQDENIKEIFDQYENMAGIQSEVSITISKFEGLKRMSYFLSKQKGQDLGFRGRISNFTQRIIGIVIAWTPNTFSEIARNLRVMGFQKWIARGIGQKFYMTMFVMPWILAAQKTIASFLIAEHNKKERLKGEKGVLWTNQEWLGMNEKEVIDLVGPDYKSYFSAISTLYLRKVWEVEKYIGLPVLTELEGYSPFLNFLTRDFTKDYGFDQFKNDAQQLSSQAKKMNTELTNEGKKDPNFQKLLDSSGVLKLNYDTLNKQLSEKANESILQYDQNN
jgi:hypothetical protein